MPLFSQKDLSNISTGDLFADDDEADFDYNDEDVDVDYNDEGSLLDEEEEDDGDEGLLDDISPEELQDLPSSPPVGQGYQYPTHQGYGLPRMYPHALS